MSIARGTETKRKNRHYKITNNEFKKAILPKSHFNSKSRQVCNSFYKGCNSFDKRSAYVRERK